MKFFDFKTKYVLRAENWTFLYLKYLRVGHLYVIQCHVGLSNRNLGQMFKFLCFGEFLCTSWADDQDFIFMFFFKPTLTSGDPIQSKCFSRLLFSFVEFSSNQPVVGRGLQHGCEGGGCIWEAPTIAPRRLKRQWARVLWILWLLLCMCRCS